MYRYIAFICVFLFLSGAAVAQKKKPEDPQPNSIDPNYAEEHYVPKTAKRKKKFEVTFEARNEYKDRMEKNWKQREKVKK